MKRFLTELGVFFLIVTALYCALSVAVMPDSAASNDYLAAIRDKHERISRIARPKIIFSGGSNLAFGLHSEMMEKAFGVPVVNLGLHGGLGLGFMLRELKDVAEAGDVVIFSIEYFLKADGDYALQQEVARVFEDASVYCVRTPKSYIQFHLDRTRDNLRAWRYKKKDEPFSSEVYQRESFNQYGDIAEHIGTTPEATLYGSSHRTYRYWEGINALNRFMRFARKNNIAVFFSYPCLAASEYERNRDVIKRLDQDIRRDLDIEVVGKVEDFVLPNRYFLNTVYHLTAEGRVERTRRLIALLLENPSVVKTIQNAQR